MGKHPSKVLLTRMRWAAYMLPTVLVTAAVGSAAAWLSGEVRFSTAPLGVLAIWAMLHFWTPREGLKTATIQGTPGAQTMLWFCAAALLLTGILAAVNTYLLGHSMDDPLEWYHVALFSPPVLLLFLGAYFSDRQKRPEKDKSPVST